MDNYYIGENMDTILKYIKQIILVLTALLFPVLIITIFTVDNFFSPKTTLMTYRIFDILLILFSPCHMASTSASILTFINAYEAIDDDKIDEFNVYNKFMINYTDILSIFVVHFIPYILKTLWNKIKIVFRILKVSKKQKD
jgi:hypothetical protein